jgi:hypothetical protein
MTTQTANQEGAAATAYVPPTVETVLTAEQLLAEVVYGGEVISCGGIQSGTVTTVCAEDIAAP